MSKQQALHDQQKAYLPRNLGIPVQAEIAAQAGPSGPGSSATMQFLEGAGVDTATIRKLTEGSDPFTKDALLRMVHRDDTTAVIQCLGGRNKQQDLFAKLERAS